MNTRIQAIHTRLTSGFVSYEDGSALREQLEQATKESYIPKHEPSAYLQFMSSNPGSYERLHPQDNEPHVWRFFSVASQHVYGDSLEQTLDIAMDKAAAGATGEAVWSRNGNWRLSIPSQ